MATDTGRYLVTAPSDSGPTAITNYKNVVKVLQPGESGEFELLNTRAQNMKRWLGEGAVKALSNGKAKTEVKKPGRPAKKPEAKAEAETKDPVLEDAIAGWDDGSNGV